MFRRIRIYADFLAINAKSPRESILVFLGGSFQDDVQRLAVVTIDAHQELDCSFHHGGTPLHILELRYST